MSRYRSLRPSAHASAALTTILVFRLVAQPARLRRDRGDVPGWVLITVMTAGLVSTLWVFAGSALLEMFKSAINSVSGK